MRISDWSSDVCSSDLRYQCAEGEFPFPVEWLAGCAAAGRAKAKPERQGGTISGGREAGFESKTALLPESRPLLCDHARQRLEGALDRKSTRLNSSHSCATRMPSSARKKKNYTQLKYIQ